MKGRKQLPTAVKQLKGTERPHRVNGDEPEFEAADLNMPEFLNAEARKHYLHFHAILSRARVLTQADCDTLALYCEAWEKWVEATKAINLHGTMIEDPETGFPTINPWVKHQHALMDKCLRFSVELGITPAARTRVKATKTQEAQGNKFLKLAK
jgi:P27 family predicted phage terminase small subunit